MLCKSGTSGIEADSVGKALVKWTWSTQSKDYVFESHRCVVIFQKSYRIVYIVVTT